MNSATDLVGKVAFVTGSSSGIGAATAIELARRGASVILHGRSKSIELENVRKSIESIGRGVSTVCCDFSVDRILESFSEKVWQCFDGVQIVVNNAGGDVLTGGNAEFSFKEKLDYLWHVDINATLMLSRLLGQRMKEQGDSIPGSRSIVNVGWDQALQGMAGDSGELFATIKGAIMSMTASLAQSLAPEVRVNCVAPGWIRTDWGANASEYWDQRARSESLMGRWGQPEDIAQAVAFLASDSAKFISAQTLNVNGGFRFYQGRNSDE